MNNLLRNFVEGFKRSFTYQEKDFPAGVKAVFQAIFFLSTILVTLWLAPYVDQKFNENERKLVFYSSIINELNSDTKNLLGNLSVLTKSDIRPTKKEDIYIDTRKIITKLHWRSVEFAIIFSGTEISDEIRRYQKSLEDLEEDLNGDGKSGKYNVDRRRFENFAYASASLLKALAVDADVIKEPINK